MPLQQMLIAKIDQGIGREEMISGLKRCAHIASEEDGKLLLNAANYFDELYRSSVDVAADTLKYMEVTKKTIQVLQHYVNTMHCDIMKFVKELIEYKVEYVSNLRRLG